MSFQRFEPIITDTTSHPRNFIDLQFSPRRVRKNGYALVESSDAAEQEILEMQTYKLMERPSGQQSEGMVYVIDDEESCRFILQSQLENIGYRVQSYRTPESFLEEFSGNQIGCIIVDYRMPSMSGAELVRKIRHLGSKIPFIVVSGYATVSMAVELMQMGAISVLEKPYRQDQLFRSVDSAIGLDLRVRQNVELSVVLRQRLARLTFREMEVLRLAKEGQLTKHIGKELGISNKTVEVHRSNIIKKMEVDSMLQLVHMLANCRIDLEKLSSSSESLHIE